ncbi:hypothetical protein AX16_000097 [Volvariella volvacea WC 439]|nr:hypothetical protein AX16_000097 [Volvariella volvacea WC 439]
MASFGANNPVYALGSFDIAIVATLAVVFYKLLPALWRKLTRNSLSLPVIQGPPSESYFFGMSKLLLQAENATDIYEGWAQKYGPVFRIPGAFGLGRIVICDPKATAHYHSKETYVYVQTKVSRKFIEILFGKGLLWAEGDSHKRQRKALTPAFSNAAIRRLTSVFYDSAYKVKAAWDNILDSDENAIIEVQTWMNHVSLDSIGIAGFGHDFKTLEGKKSSVLDVFDSFGSASSTVTPIFSVFVPIMPFLLYLPTERNKAVARWRKTMSNIANDLLVKTKLEKEKEGIAAGSELAEEKSIIGMLIKAENSGMSQEEILAQNILLFAGYETTSISLTWALIELSQNLEKQQRLREELPSLSSPDPTWDQLTSGLPYLDAVVHEVLRLHPPVREISRTAAEDDVIPLSTPITTATGETLTSLPIPKGTTISSPIHYLNRAMEFWGPDAKEFRPERWLDADGNEWDGLRAKELQGHRHLLTFSDGPRICLGRGIALTEFKAVLATLIRNYAFEFPNGPSTKITRHLSILPRPKVAGEAGARVPLRIRRVT